jgi:acyl-CoA synthetase (AMP-forming)/AMP-acid ligase II
MHRRAIPTLGQLVLNVTRQWSKRLSCRHVAFSHPVRGDVDYGDADAAEQLLAFCRRQLSAIKCPRSIDFEAERPCHPTGKLCKRLLRDRYWQGGESKIV